MVVHFKRLRNPVMLEDMQLRARHTLPYFWREQNNCWYDSQLVLHVVQPTRATLITMTKEYLKDNGQKQDILKVWKRYL